MGWLENAFSIWMKNNANPEELANPDPNYFYKGAFLAGERKDETGHGSSAFKGLSSPERYVMADNSYWRSQPGPVYDTITGEWLDDFKRRAAKTWLDYYNARASQNQ